MFLVKKMHGKQITESLDLPNHEPTQQQAGHMQGEVAPFFSFNVKRTVEMVQICFLIPFPMSFHIGFSHQLHWTFSPFHPVPLVTSRVSDNCSGH